MKKIRVELDYASTRHPSDDTLDGRPHRLWIAMETKRLDKVSAGLSFTADTVRRGRAGRYSTPRNARSFAHNARASKEHDGEPQHHSPRRNAGDGLPHGSSTMTSLLTRKG
jgi:hypothetical protein